MLVYNISHGGFGMTKQSTDVQKLLAGALLIFDKFDNVDLEILNEFLIAEKDTFVLGKDISKIDKFFDIEDGIITLKHDLSLNDKQSEATVEEQLKLLVGEELLNYFSNLDMKMFTLKKLQKIGNIPLEESGLYFNTKQKEALESLLDEYSVLLIWDEDDMYGSHLDFVVTSFGLCKIFEYDNKKAVELFKQQVEKNGLNPTFVSEFLRCQELDKPAEQVLSISNFKKFTEKYSEILKKDARSYIKK